MIGADRRRRGLSCVLPKGVPQGQTESGGIAPARRRSRHKKPTSDPPRFRWIRTRLPHVGCWRKSDVDGGVCLFRHHTAHMARRRTRATTSCRGGCRGLAELRFESLGARGGSQSPAHARETGPTRLATRRGGTRPTGVQYFSARGEKCARLSCTHTAVSLAIVRGRGRARGARILPFHVRIGQGESQP